MSFLFPILPYLLVIVLIVVLGLVEQYYHNAALAKIPVRVHVNGARGKSSVVRLISAGLRAGGKEVFAKVTGTSPRIIDSKGNDIPIHRFKSASIGEQIKIINFFSKKNIDIAVFECMAVNPQYQWVSEHSMIKSNIGVITNVRPDHLDEMGMDENQIACSLSNTIPFNGKFISNDSRYENLYKNISKDRETKFISIDSNLSISKEMKRFSYLEHEENVLTALKVCEELGVDCDIAIEGMISAKPDPGSLIALNLYIPNKNILFVNAMAANDPSSTFKIWEMVNSKYSLMKKCIFFNTRSDRVYRTNQILKLIEERMIPDKLIIRGDKNILSPILEKLNLKIEIDLVPNNIEFKELIKLFFKHDESLIFAIGNMVGWGESLMEKIDTYKS